MAMSRATVIIRNLDDRKRASSWVYQAPFGTRVEFKEVKRTLDQNSKLWAMLTDVARQVRWAGMKLTPGDWKFIFLDALSRERRIVPNIDGTGIVPLYKSTSDLSKSEMSDLIELILAFGAKHEVKFSDEEVAA
jgi:hypothetical protein